MVNRKGEDFSSFVKIDTETGKISYSKTQDGFNERPAFKVPAEVWGVSLKSTEIAALQDGKAVFIADMTGFEGQKFDSWLKVNQNQAKLDFHNENPDAPKQTVNKTEKPNPPVSQKEEKPKTKNNKRRVS